jgi:hypothetical protein
MPPRNVRKLLIALEPGQAMTGTNGIDPTHQASLCPFEAIARPRCVSFAGFTDMHQGYRSQREETRDR